MGAARFGGSRIKEALDPADPEPTMTESPRESASRIVSILLACLAAITGFFAFNVVGGVFGLVQATLGLAAAHGAMSTQDEAQNTWTYRTHRERGGAWQHAVRRQDEHGQPWPGGHDADGEAGPGPWHQFHRHGG